MGAAYANGENDAVLAGTAEKKRFLNTQQQLDQHGTRP